MQNNSYPDLASQNQSQHYATQLGSFDNQRSSQNQSHWLEFMAALDNLGGSELENRLKENQRLLRENGVTYTVYDDKAQLNHLWKLDPIPLLISAAEWGVIEQGVKQRAELLGLILNDLYGQQNLLKQGILPAELVYAHQGFLIPCIGSLQQSASLTLYAANLARGCNGNIWVLNDHTQAPSGIGYTMENRNVTGRVMADLFQASHVQRLTPFFNKLQQSLAQTAPHNKSEPHIVVMTPGPLNETYFEHAYLASNLGFTLAQGDDLTVRDSKVWLRTLEGLQSVDVLLRRVDDDYCDPLELRNSSKLGVAGLLQAVRSGNVSIANPLGSSILENQGLLAFLPALCRYFLDQDLLLPSVASWWCGHRKECDFVISNLSKLVIKSINRGGPDRAIFGDQLSSQQRADLIKKIKAKPYLFVGQEQITFSTAPSLINGQIEERNSILRSFAVASDDGYSVMPGGLTRVAMNKNQITVTNQQGAVNKDTWVLDGEEYNSIKLPGFSQQIIVPAISEPLTSRAADNLFWVGRHFERILGSTRLIRTILLKQTNLLNGLDRNNHQQCMQVLLCALTHLTVSYPGFIKKKPLQGAEQTNEILSIFQDQQRNGSLAHNIQAFFQAANNIRDLWSQETWRCIDSIKYYWEDQVVAMSHPHSQLDQYLSELNTRLAAFSGLTSESMSRESGWILLQLGRKLERSVSIISLIRATLVQKQPKELLHPLLEAILLTTDSFSIYQRRYRSATRLPMVLDLLLKDKSHPSSLLFQLQHLKQYIAVLPRQDKKNQLRREEGLILKANTELQLCDSVALLSDNGMGVHDDLEKLLATTTEQLTDIADSITQRYFNHITGVHQLSDTCRGSHEV